MIGDSSQVGAAAHVTADGAVITALIADNITGMNEATKYFELLIKAEFVVLC